MRRYSRPGVSAAAWLSWTLLILSQIVGIQCMTSAEIAALKQEARNIFYHGLDNYHRHAYPEDELRPLSCQPLTRDRDNPLHLELNDALGNYSLSVVDTLSTLAILASTADADGDKHNALGDFQYYVRLLVEDYGDGTIGPDGQGRRARGFDLDSKVQVFETTIRGLGGLLSAHLFAIGELPIRGYDPITTGEDIVWETKDSRGRPFVYNGQLLRLAVDLGKRLLPAFDTPTGLPYPRVNLRHGAYFYLNHTSDRAQCPSADPSQCPSPEAPLPLREVTETCSAGAGSLMLEFASLSHLTGDPLYAQLAKKAFEAVWARRSSLGLVGSGIDAETGFWISPVTGIGAGIDSFYEYAFKSHILLSGRLPLENHTLADDFLRVWQESRVSLSRHLYRGTQHQHPHYAQNDKDTGGFRMAWIDSLSAYYPGLLTLSGDLEEATSLHLFYTALWTRYGALPERWNTMTGKIESGLGWWGGRPEFIESTWYLYRATRDPWYLRVGEMVLRDIKRRCYTPCGWAGLQNVATGEQTDRMESFFLGETVKYLYLLFDLDHPLNTLDKNFVFTTEGHPLILPKQQTGHKRTRSAHDPDDDFNVNDRNPAPQCPAPPARLPLTGSAVAARPDLFHAAVLSRLYNKSSEARQFENSDGQLPLLPPSSTSNADRSRPGSSIPHIKYGFYPWTIPQSLLPVNGQSARMKTPKTFELTFPLAQNTPPDFGALQRVQGGILVKSLSGLRLGFVLDKSEKEEEDDAYRVHSLSNLALGRDESIWLGSQVMSRMQPMDPQLSRVKDLESVDIFIDAPAESDEEDLQATEAMADNTAEQPLELLAEMFQDRSGIDSAVQEDGNIVSAIDKLLAQPNAKPARPPQPLVRYRLPAALSTGAGAAFFPSELEISGTTALSQPGTNLPLRRIFVLDSPLCSLPLPVWIPKTYQVLVIKRGDCRFDEKLRLIPSFAPTLTSLKMVLVVSFDEVEIRPLLDRVQLTPAGVERRHPLPVLLVAGGVETWEVFARVAAGRGEEVRGEIVAVPARAGVGGMGIRRRYWFESDGIRVANLFVQ